VSDKSKKFQPPTGFVVAVHQNIFAIRGLSNALDISPYLVAKALENSGYYLQADIMDLSADSAKVILLQEQKGTDLKVVKDESDSNNSADGGDTVEGTI
jgi:hypothetical protein